MKIKAFSFLGIFFALVLMIPIYNTFSYGLKMVTGFDEFKEYYFNFDNIERFVNFKLYPLKISLEPKKVTIGKDGWFFLTGNDDVMLKTRGQDLPPVEKITESISLANYWAKKLQQLAVSGFYITVPANKHTVYSEYLPNWAKTGKPTLSDLYFSYTDSNMVLDMSGSLLAAKSNSDTRLYYKTDTHWNNLGAMYGYISMKNFLEDKHPDIQWLGDKEISVGEIERRNGGDLSAFLKINQLLLDEEPQIEINIDKEIITTQTDYYSGEIKHKGMNKEVSSPVTPLYVHSPNALNNTRVVWLRDSFGNNLSPFIAATFTDVIQQHYARTFKEPDKFIQLVKEFEPELVIVTSAERMIPTYFHKPKKQSQEVEGITQLRQLSTGGY